MSENGKKEAQDYYLAEDGTFIPFVEVKSISAHYEATDSKPKQLHLVIAGGVQRLPQQQLSPWKARGYV